MNIAIANVSMDAKNVLVKYTHFGLVDNVDWIKALCTLKEQVFPHISWYDPFFLPDFAVGNSLLRFIQAY